VRSVAEVLRLDQAVQPELLLMRRQLLRLLNVKEFAAAAEFKASLIVCLSVHPSIRLSICLSVRQGVCGRNGVQGNLIVVCPFVHPSACPSVCPSVSNDLCFARMRVPRVCISQPFLPTVGQSCDAA
jgi:hypothetical protein